VSSSIEVYRAPGLPANWEEGEVWVGEVSNTSLSHSGLHTRLFLFTLEQSVEPTRVTVSGNTQSLSLALSMISDVCKGTFKGFALLRQMTQQQRGPGAPHPAMLQSRPVYAPGYGLIPPSQVGASRCVVFRGGGEWG
jgi:hypothetical protein